MEPRFVHDCDQCRLFYADDQGDWYTCGAEDGRSVICRYGSDGSQYRSTLIGGTVQITTLELGALARGLTLTNQESLKVLSLMLDRTLEQLPRERWLAVVPSESDGPAWRGW